MAKRSPSAAAARAAQAKLNAMLRGKIADSQMRRNEMLQNERNWRGQVRKTR